MLHDIFIDNTIVTRPMQVVKRIIAVWPIRGTPGSRIIVVGRNCLWTERFLLRRNFVSMLDPITICLWC